MKRILPIATLLATLLTSCSGELPVKNEVIIHHRSDPEMLNPVNYTDANVANITAHMFMKLVEADFRNPQEYVPVLASERPKIEVTADGQMHMHFSLRKEAKWDNGQPVTANDVVFTLKVMKNPAVNNPNFKPYVEFINDVKIDPSDPLKFTIISKAPYFLAESVFGDVPILPEYLYDPKGLMKNFTVQMLANQSDSLKDLEPIKEFAEDFNSEKRMRDPSAIGGCGAYKFTQWITNERVILEKKKDWWGDALEKENCFFEAYPEKLIFQTIKDVSTAVVSMKAGNIDVMGSIDSKEYENLRSNQKFLESFELTTPTEFSYVYIGLNSAKPILRDRLTRQALAHLADVDNMIRTVKYGLAEPVIGAIHPVKKYYNKDIQRYVFSLEKAKELLVQAGWKNTNNDETLDKIIDGKHTEFEVDFALNAGNEERKAIALMFQAEAKKIGIRINVVPIDWAVYLEKCRQHDFDIMIGKWLGGPGPDDLKQTYHSKAATGEGSNYCNFSNSEADSLMDKINYEIDETKRNNMFMRLQKVMYDEVPVIFLYSPKEKIAVHKKFDNASTSVVRPGFWAQGFILRQNAAH